MNWKLKEAFFGVQTLQTCNDVELDDQVPDDCAIKNDLKEDMACVGEERKISSPSRPKESFNDDTIGILSNKKQIIDDLESKKGKYLAIRLLWTILIKLFRFFMLSNRFY